MKHDFPAERAAIHPTGALETLLGSAQRLPTVPLFDLPIISERKDAVAEAIVARARHGKRTVVNFLNAHCVNVLHRDTAYRRAVQESDLVLPDGSGLRIASKLVGHPFADNLNGTDLFPRICREAQAQGQSIFLLGGMPGIAEATGEAMQRTFPKLRIAGSADGYFEAGEEDALIARINAAKPDIVLVGLGVPLQEKWIARVKQRLIAPVVLGVGGLFDYYSGRIARAPRPLRAIGCEWLWRLAMEPRRLAKRYLLGNLVFLIHAIAHAIQARGWSGRLSAATKRRVDVATSGAAIVMLLPLFLCVALAIRLEDKGPVFFRQLRIGEHGRCFEMIKFRSMFTDAEARRARLLAQSERDGICFKMRNDPRITRTGRFIRRFSIDELPQLWNVLRGDMSLVGPRPALACEVQAYSRPALKRLGGKPGVTCIWQVSGRAEIPFKQQLAMDVAYLRRRGLVTDMAILLRTLPAVISGKGAY